MAATPRSARSTPTVPFLPGYGAHAVKVHQRKAQTLSFGPGGAMDANRSGEMPKLDLSTLNVMKDPMHRFDTSARSMTHDEREALRDSARNTYRPDIAPAWLKHDRQVLKFNAYFQEPVHENPKENFRVRHCTIFYYLEDGTMMVSEPKIENSGLPQGTFVKRHRIPKPQNLGAGGYYTYDDLTVGTTINIYCRGFRIIDCDDFTRQFYLNALGVELEPGEGAPMDSFRASEVEASSMQLSSRNVVNEGKEYNELALGGNRKNEKLQQYLENDRKVLAFKCYWDDPTPYGSRMYYTLHYYLSDDSIEMLENLARNSGRDPYPVFWRRGQLRKNPSQTPAPGMMEPESDICKPEDFIVGQSVSVYGRDIMLYECDGFTKDFYRQYMGVEQGCIEIKQPEPVHVTLNYPPHTGFGTEEDSLASCLALTPRMPFRDINKLMLDADKVLRFKGKMVNSRQEDAGRMFVVGIYLADNEVGVWELHQRNSGHSEGKWASKSRKKNPATGTWFCPQDFAIGATVEVNAIKFALIQADRGTLARMEDSPDEYPMSNADLIRTKIWRLQDGLMQAGTISAGELQSMAAEKLGVKLLDHELVTLVRRFGGDPGADKMDANGVISLEKLFPR